MRLKYVQLVGTNENVLTKLADKRTSKMVDIIFNSSLSPTKITTYELSDDYYTTFTMFLVLRLFKRWLEV
jgi:hypothetical protein